MKRTRDPFIGVTPTAVSQYVKNDRGFGRGSLTASASRRDRSGDLFAYRLGSVRLVLKSRKNTQDRLAERLS